MKIVSHRRNTRSELLETETKYGIEVDIRSERDRLIIHHDPYIAGEDFDQWIKAYQHALLILNVKEEGLEPRLTALMKYEGITDYFFLDQSFPFLIKSSLTREHRCAVRVSEFESVETALTLAGKIEWVWVDFFTQFPLTEKDGKRLKDAGFKICLVSPELQGHDAYVEIPRLLSNLNEKEIIADAVCTKHPKIWETLLHT